MAFWRRWEIIKEPRVNRQIKAREVRVIDENGKNLGVMFIMQALNMAEEKGLDLVEVSPNATPPVVRIMDYGKYKYEQKKRIHEAKRHAHILPPKEIRLHLKTDPHDLKVKAQKARDILDSLHKVQITMILRGRERKHKDIALNSMRKVWEMLEDIARMEREPTEEGNRIVMLCSPKPELVKQKERERQKAIKERRSDKS